MMTSDLVKDTTMEDAFVAIRDRDWRDPIPNRATNIVAGDRICWREPVFGAYYRGRRARPAGERTIQAVVVRESYGATRGQHTFTLRVERSQGYCAIEPGKQILRKGRSLYGNAAMMGSTLDPEEREKAACDKAERAWTQSAAAIRWEGNHQR